MTDSHKLEHTLPLFKTEQSNLIQLVLREKSKGFCDFFFEFADFFETFQKLTVPPSQPTD